MGDLKVGLDRYGGGRGASMCIYMCVGVGMEI